MSASGDYGVRIVESFAPPANWLPGQEVNKDVYVTNTGNIGAFVGMDVSGTLSIKKDMSVAVPTTTTINKYTIHYNDGTAQTEDLLPDDYAAKVAVDTNAGKTYYTPDPTNDPDTKYEVTQTDVDSTTVANDGVFDCVELTNDERYAVEAGAYLAYKPAADVMNELGRQAVNYKGTPTTTYVYTAFKAPDSTQLVSSDTELVLTNNPNTSAAEMAANAKGYDKQATVDGTTYYFKSTDAPTELTSNGTDFTPRADGLYVFRRSIDVDSTGFGADGIGKGAESFTYDGYYYYGGKYYKIADLSVTPDDVADIAGDTVQTDGNLAAASANLVKEVTDYANPVDLEYDNANHRLIATYKASVDDLDDALKDAAEALDAAEHEYAAAELELRRAILDAASEDAAVQAATTARDQAQKERDDAQKAYDEAKAKFEALKQRYNDAKDEFDAAQSAVASDIADLVGDDNSQTITITAGTGALVSRATAANAAAGTKAKAYADANSAYTDFVDDHTLPLNYTGDDDSIEHIYWAYLQELSNTYSSDYNIADAVFADTAHPTAAELETEIKRAVSKLGYDKLHGFTPAADDVYHDFHDLLTKKVLATNEYEAALQKYVDDVAELNNVINTLNDATGTGTLTTIDTTTAQNKSGIEALNAETSKLYDALDKARKAYDGTEGDPLNSTLGTGGAIGALAAAEAALLEAEKDLKDATNNVEGNDNVKQSLKDAWGRYYKAKNALATARQAKADAQKKYDENADLKIYIYLKNDVLVGGGNGKKWQIDPTTIGADETAHFYYTNILKGGQTSEQLIDKVVLDSRVTQDMYKYFDFDLNVAMNSAQIVYAADNKTILTTPATEEMHKTATLTNPTDIDTPITWS